MAKMRSKIRASFDRFFPERQIYHRSGGTVRYISISPWQQVILAAGAIAMAIWLLFATAHFLIKGPSYSGGIAGSQDIAKYERWVQELRAKDALSRSLLEERTDAFDRTVIQFEDRHKTLEAMIRKLQNGGDLEITSLRGNGAGLLVEASIDEADVRQARESVRQEASIEVVGTRARMDSMYTGHEDYLNFLEDIAVERGEAARGILKLTGTGTGRIETNSEMGGPLIALPASLTGASTPEEAEFKARVSRVYARMQESEYYEDLVAQLPLAVPSSKHLRHTSPYGVRTDPFTKNATWHGGVDLAHGWRAPITAAGPGKIVYAGYKSGYGKVVDIEHGFGFKSRYAHLLSIKVKKGDTVAMGDQVGLMGSSGRSTGPHLHYEVHFNDKQYDPAKFLKAGRHVYENK